MNYSISCRESWDVLQRKRCLKQARMGERYSANDKTCACVGERRCVMPTDLVVRCMWRSPTLWLADRNDCPASLLQLFAVLGAIGMMGTRCDA